jgi:hypothetical protein
MNFYILIFNHFQCVAGFFSLAGNVKVFYTSLHFKYNEPGIWLVGDFKALSYQVTNNVE